MSGCRGEAPAGAWGSASRLTPQREANKRANSPQGYEACGINALQKLWNQLRAPPVLLAQGGRFIDTINGWALSAKTESHGRKSSGGRRCTQRRNEVYALAQTSFRLWIDGFTGCAKMRAPSAYSKRVKQDITVVLYAGTSPTQHKHLPRNSLSFNGSFRLDAMVLPPDCPKPVETSLPIQYTVFIQNGISAAIVSESEGIQ